MTGALAGPSSKALVANDELGSGWLRMAQGVWQHALGRVAHGGALVLSGVLARQADEVIASYAPFISLSVWAELDGWVALAGHRPD